MIKNLLKEQYVEVSRDYHTKKVNESGQEARFAKVIKKGGFEANITDRVVFQRFLGHYEILNGYRWHEVDETDCYLCHNWSYCVFLHDRKIAKDKDFYFSVDAKKLGNGSLQKKKSLLAPNYVTVEST